MLEIKKIVVNVVAYFGITWVSSRISWPGEVATCRPETKPSMRPIEFHEFLRQFFGDQHNYIFPYLEPPGHVTNLSTQESS